PLISGFDGQAAVSHFCFNFFKHLRITFQHHALGGALFEMKRSRHSEIKSGELPHVSGIFFLGNCCRKGEQESRQGQKEYLFHGTIVCWILGLISGLKARLSVKGCTEWGVCVL